MKEKEDKIQKLAKLQEKKIKSKNNSL